MAGERNEPIDFTSAASKRKLDKAQGVSAETRWSRRRKLRSIARAQRSGSNSAEPLQPDPLPEMLGEIAQRYYEVYGTDHPPKNPT